MRAGRADEAVHRDRAGPQGTVLFRPGELDETLSSPSADSEGDIARAALLGIAPPFRDQRFVLRPHRTTIGRSADNDLVLPDASVSLQHAWIVGGDEEYRLMNVLSTNGSFVNGQKVHEAPLAHGDRIRFGRAEFVFHAAVAAAGEAAADGVPKWVWVAAGAILTLSGTALVAL